jgi:hypothetical protein
VSYHQKRKDRRGKRQRDNLACSDVLHNLCGERWHRDMVPTVRTVSALVAVLVAAHFRWRFACAIATERDDLCHWCFPLVKPAHEQGENDQRSSGS